jgi:hypothetical protein
LNFTLLDYYLLEIRSDLSKRSASGLLKGIAQLNVIEDVSN